MPALNRFVWMKALVAAPAWLLADAIMFWTFGPVADRPQSGHPQAERFAAFFALAVCWTLAYPRRQGLGLIVLSCGAVALELGQWLVPGRDPRIPDVLAKIAGVVLGMVLANTIKGPRRSPASSDRPEAG